MTRQQHRAEAQASPRTAALTCALALAALVVLCLFAWPHAALADEVGGDGSFDLNLSMSVEAANDPEAAVHPVSVHVANHVGEHVGGARVAYALLSDYATPAAPAAAAASSADAQSTMVRAGEATTAADGTADLAGIVAGCDYLLTVEADGHTSHESVRTCKGEGGERWEVVMQKDAGEAGGAGAGESPLAPLFSLTRTGDALGPLVLGVAGVLMAALGLAALARRKGKEARDGR